MSRPRRDVPSLALLVGALVGLYFGWRAFWFLCDDAFIAFRYVSNSQLGHGYVWNPPPFRPVDGYTSFLWVVILDLTWRLTGVDPPAAANWVSLAFSAGSVVLLWGMASRMRYSDALRPWRSVFVGVVLLGVLTNRTFLAWTSSGLETALFNFTLLWWLFALLWGAPRKARFSGHLALATVAMCLARPDGLPFAGMTALAMLWEGRNNLPRARLPHAAGVGFLVLGLGAFFLWKRWLYGAWLPNTYHAKVLAPWPEAGLMYLGSFVVEYGLWMWALVVALGLVAAARRGDRPGVRPIAACIAIAYHVGYYTLVIGGDHFEFRAFSYLVPLVFLSFVWALNALTRRRIAAVALLGGFIAVGWPIPWIHWAGTHELDSREETFKLTYAVAPHLPAPVRAYGEWFDDMQADLIDRFVCMRHQEHRVFLEFKQDLLPTRAMGRRIEYQQHPVHVGGEVGLTGWVLPHVAIIDGFGLNDYFIARNTEVSRPERTMGHERRAPPGYIEAFRSNVEFRAGRFVVEPRKRPLTAVEIRAIERRYLVWTRHLQ